jgi:hypothetical protein
METYCCMKKKLQSYIGLTMDLLVPLWHHASKPDATGGGVGYASISTQQES